MFITIIISVTPPPPHSPKMHHSSNLTTMETLDMGCCKILDQKNKFFQKYLTWIGQIQTRQLGHPKSGSLTGS